MACLANLSLLGFPFLAGFFSKDLILEGAYNRGERYQGLVWFLVGVGLTTAYSLKILGLVLPVRGQQSPSLTVGGGWGRPVKGPTITLGAGAALGGAVLCCGGAPVVVSGVDKSLPLVFIAGGLGLARAVRGLRLGYFSSM